VANIKITELTNLTDPSTTDVMPVVDVDADVTKKVSVGEVVGKITGDVDVATDGTSSIAAGVIVDADVNANAEIAVSKLADGAARQLLQTDAAGNGVEWTNNVDVPGTLDVTGATTLDSTLDVDGQSTLASAAVSDLTEDRVVIAGASGELEDSANLTFDGNELGITGTLDVSSNGTIGGDLTVVGDLTVEGVTTTLETQTLVVEDKNIELGVVGTPTDTTADGGGITLKGATDKTINWVNATDAWTSSEHVELASGKEFYIDGNGVLNATTLGSGVVNSSLTSVGTIATGTWEGDAIDAAYLDSTVVTTSDTGTVTSTMILDDTIVNGDINASAAIADTKLDTISTAGKVSNSATTATDSNTANAIVARDAFGDFTAGTITADLAGNADTATALETARDIGGVSFDGTANINLPGVNTTGNQDTSGNAATATKLDSSRTFEVTGDVTGTVSSDLTSGASISTSIASGVIVDGDVNASAAIAGTKIDPDFGSQTVETTGNLAINTDVLFVDSSSRRLLVNTSSGSHTLTVNGTAQIGNSQQGTTSVGSVSSGVATTVLTTPTPGFGTKVVEVLVSAVAGAGNSVITARFLWQVNGQSGSNTRNVLRESITNSSNLNTGNRTYTDLTATATTSGSDEILQITPTHGGAISFTTTLYVTYRTIFGSDYT